LLSSRIDQCTTKIVTTKGLHINLRYIVIFVVVNSSDLLCCINCEVYVVSNPILYQICELGEMQKQVAVTCKQSSQNLLGKITNSLSQHNHFPNIFQTKYSRMLVNVLVVLIASVFVCCKNWNMVFFCYIIAGLAIHVVEPQTSRIHLRCETVRATDPRVISTAKDSLSDTLGRVCRWHRRLCDLVDMVTSCYELPLLVVIAYCFGNTVFGTYSIITMFRNSHSLVKIPAIIWCTGYGCRLILIGFIPSLTVAQVSGYEYDSRY
jgi:hypothetical protein